MENSLSTLIDSASGILILLPDNPDFDVVAAGLGLFLSLRDQKQTAISCKSPMVVGFNRLIGVNKIGSEPGNKNLTIKFKDYDAKNIEKVSYDIIDGEFNLTVTPKSGQVAPQSGNIDLNYSGVSADLIILVGGVSDTDFSMIGESQITGAKIVHIGTRVLTAVGAETLSFAKPASSVSELVAEIIKQTGLPVDVDVATNLAMGVEEGSSNFSSSEVTPETFEVFASLLRSGAQRLPKEKKSASDFPVGSIPGVQVFQKTQDVEGTKEEEQAINPPEDWLKPKVIKGTGSNAEPQTPSENKG